MGPYRLPISLSPYLPIYLSTHPTPKVDSMQSYALHYTHSL